MAAVVLDVRTRLSATSRRDGAVYVLDFGALASGLVMDARWVKSEAPLAPGSQCIFGLATALAGSEKAGTPASAPGGQERSTAYTVALRAPPGPRAVVVAAPTPRGWEAYIEPAGSA